jgi:sugar lactone lactonase YvrE
MRVVKSVFLVVVGVLLYLLFWPIAIEPIAWQAPTAPQYVGVYQTNDKLASFEALSLDGMNGPEAVISDGQGWIYTPTHEGWVLRWREGEANPQRWLNVGGRPLGMDFDAQGNLWIANAYIGLQKITPNGEISTALDRVDGVAIKFADDAVVAPDGKVYFSDASTKFGAQESGGTLESSLLEIMEHGSTGRIIEYDPKTEQARVIMSDMSFPNGVAINDQGDYLLVAETGSYRIWKYYLRGANKGESEVLIDNLPGFPDNVHSGLDGRYWVGLTSPRSGVLDQLSEKPLLREMVQRLPAFMRPNVVPYGHVIAFMGDGTITHSLQNPSGSFAATTGVWEAADYLYISSLTETVLARISKSELGW